MLFVFGRERAFLGGVLEFRAWKMGLGLGITFIRY